MAIKGLSLKESMSRNIQAIMPLEEDKIKFKATLVEYLNHLTMKADESEEFQKNLIKYFLQKCLPNQFINTSKRTDLAIYNGSTPDSNVGVLIEVKSLNNKAEMMTKEKINSKAFQEIIHYYLHERIVHKNLEIKKCIITNGWNWFTIEAKEMEKHFYKNKSFLEMYNKWRTAQLASQTTDFLYTEVIAPAVDTAIEKSLTLAHFNLKDALKQGSRTIDIKTTNLTQLYRFFSPENLLNKEIFTDSNKLNKGFYDELLYLMGLEEKKSNNQKIINRLPEDKRQKGTFVENAIDRLQINDVPSDKHYDIAVQLSVVWVNRILFLKLLESQLVSFNGEEKYKFLTKEMLPTFDDIYYLFFGVLAKKPYERNDEMRSKYPHVPYLNSSLFEETELELSRDGLGIDRLREHQVDFYSKTVLKDSNNKRKSGKVSFLTYLFEFLNAYDFSTSIKHNKQNKNTLINAAVLGLIFEKINGYNDGSFYTPGRITMYMSKNIVRKAVIQKVNEVKGWNCETIYDIEYKINRDLSIAKEVSDIIDTIKICDPAVGSGHFLVSVLNELIAIKSELKVLIDSNGRSINDIQCTVVNDELIIQDINGDNFIYRRGNAYSERIQKAIFLEKRKLIEGCLFGVDLNPNSVNICRLRLWIELLKHSYYYMEEGYDTPQLITLPNIDINIKVGNSLLHKFNINENLDKRFTDLKNYMELVTEYKSTNNKRAKQTLTKKLIEIKKSFLNSIQTPEFKKVNKIRKEIIKTGQLNLFASPKEIKAQKQEIDELNDKLKQAELELEVARKNPLFRNGLEWRMEFPEILDDEGDFEGFDVIIANPPYIYSTMGNFSELEKDYFISEYPLSKYQANTFGLFLELSFRIMRKNGYCSMIIPNTFLTIGQYQTLREYILKNTSDVFILNSQDKIFEDASVDNCIVNFKMNKPTLVELAELKNGEVNIVNVVKPEELLKSTVINISAFSKENMDGISLILQKMEQNAKKIHENYGIVKDGLKAYERGKGNPPQPMDEDEFELFKSNKTYFSDKPEDETYRKFLDGADVQRYKINWGGKYLSYGNHLAAKRNPSIFEGERILIRRIPAKSVYAFVATKTTDNYVHEQSVETVYSLNAPVNFLLGVINSKPLSFWGLHKFDFLQRTTFPQMRLYQIKEFLIPDATEEEQETLSKVVEELLSMSESKSEDAAQKIEELNRNIDEIVMDLFKLNNEEKEVIRNFTLEN